MASQRNTTDAAHGDAGITVLIVDDDEALRYRLGRAFADRGYQVRLAGGCDEAESLARRDPPELAVVDLRMKDGSGLPLIQFLKELEPATRVIVLTGYGSIATAIDAMRLGAAHYLPKPADVDDILTAFAKADEPPRVAREAQEFSAPSLARAEWEHINRVLSDVSGNISEAARRLGIHRRSLQRKLHKMPPNA